MTPSVEYRAPARPELQARAHLELVDIVPDAFQSGDVAQGQVPFRRQGLLQRVGEYGDFFPQFEGLSVPDSGKVGRSIGRSEQSKINVVVGADHFGFALEDAGQFHGNAATAAYVVTDGHNVSPAIEEEAGPAGEKSVRQVKAAGNALRRFGVAKRMDVSDQIVEHGFRQPEVRHRRMRMGYPVLDVARRVMQAARNFLERRTRTLLGEGGADLMTGGTPGCRDFPAAGRISSS